jgi:hypothetical protein
MEESASSETKEDTTNSRLRVMEVQTLTSLGTFGHTNRRKMIVINLDLAVTCQRARAVGE